MFFVRNKIDAEITFKSIKKGNQIYMALENGEKPLNRRVLAEAIKLSNWEENTYWSK